MTADEIRKYYFLAKNNRLVNADLWNFLREFDTPVKKTFERSIENTDRYIKFNLIQDDNYYFIVGRNNSTVKAKFFHNDEINPSSCLLQMMPLYRAYNPRISVQVLYEGREYTAINLLRLDGGFRILTDIKNNNKHILVIADNMGGSYLRFEFPYQDLLSLFDDLKIFMDEYFMAWEKRIIKAKLLFGFEK